MRKQFSITTSRIIEQDDSTILILGDIGVFAFNEAIRRFPERAMNIGILEQSSVSIAAGLSASGYIPIVHTIAPFIVERALEQIKVDFGYQQLRGNLVSVGASYDYAALGCTHHCPGDVAILKTIPNIQIIVPGNAAEVDSTLTANYDNDQLSYYRLSEVRHNENIEYFENGASLVKRGSRGVVVVIGPLLSRVIAAVVDLDLTVMYCNQVLPFNTEMLYSQLDADTKVSVVMPFYESTLTHLIIGAMGGKGRFMGAIGVPEKFLDSYGSVTEHDEQYGLTEAALKKKLSTYF